MLSGWKLWIFLGLTTLALPVLESEPVATLFFGKNPFEISVQMSRDVLLWKRERLRGGERATSPKIMKQEFPNGRSVLWFPDLALVDVGAMPSKEWPALEAWMRAKSIRFLIWRKSDRHLKDFVKLDKLLPASIEQVWWISKTGKPEPKLWEGQVTRRLWTTGSKFRARLKHAPFATNY